MKQICQSGGFSLVEVNLAILLVALGMLALFGLFPSGLRQGENAVNDTHAALLGDYILSGIEANASTTTAWNTWRNVVSTPQFRTAVVNGIKPDGATQISPAYLPPGQVSPAVTFANSKAKYILEISGDDYTVIGGTPQVRKVSLWVWSGEYVSGNTNIFKAKAKFFYTEVCYPGIAP
jgi:hypothetical protein